MTVARFLADGEGLLVELDRPGDLPTQVIAETETVQNRRFSRAIIHLAVDCEGLLVEIDRPG